MSEFRAFEMELDCPEIFDVSQNVDFTYNDGNWKNNFYNKETGETKLMDVGVIKFPLIKHPYHGIMTSYETLLYPRKLVIDARMLERVNMIKKNILAFISIITLKPIRYFLLLIFLFPKRMVEDLIYGILGAITNSTNWTLRPYIQPQYFCPIAREVYTVGVILAKETPERPVIQETTKLVSSLLFFDDSYRYVVQDAAGLINRQAFLDDPAKEIKRVIEIIANRFVKQGTDTELKIRKIGTLLYWGIKLYKPFRLWIKRVAKLLDFDRMKLDDIDFYWIANLPDYNYLGLTLTERKEKFKTLKGYATTGI